MNKQELKAKLDAAIKNDDKAATLELMKPLIDNLASRIQAGALKKVIKGFLQNGGITGKCNEMILEIAVIRAERFMQYKAR